MADLAYTTVVVGAYSLYPLCNVSCCLSLSIGRVACTVYTQRLFDICKPTNTLHNQFEHIVRGKTAKAMSGSCLHRLRID